MTIYLDTSVLVAALTNEPKSRTVQDWLVRQEAQRPAISEWVVTEFSSALAIKLRSGQIGPDHRSAALAMFARLAGESLRKLAITRLQFHTAARFVDQHVLALRAGDALHLAVCVDYGATLATLDHRQGAAASTLGVNAILL